MRPYLKQLIAKTRNFVATLFPNAHNQAINQTYKTSVSKVSSAVIKALKMHRLDWCGDETLQRFFHAKFQHCRKKLESLIALKLLR